jgi:outer membrane protein OmpA-like peptidoglycan-associated protein
MPGKILKLMQVVGGLIIIIIPTALALVAYYKLHQNDQYIIFKIFTIICAIPFYVILVIVAWIHVDDPQNKGPNRSTNYLAGLLGASLGWLLGIVLEPFTSGEAGKFITYAGAISTFFAGYGAGKLDDLIKYIFNPQNLTRRRAFHGALFLVSFVVTLIVVYQSRFGVYELSITTTSPLPDAMANKAYGPVRIDASGGIPPLKWDITPALPEDLSLDRNIGVISGTPKGVSGPTNYRITVTDNSKPSLSSSKDLSLEVKAVGSQPSVPQAPPSPPPPGNGNRSEIHPDGKLEHGFQIFVAGPNIDCGELAKAVTTAAANAGPKCVEKVLEGFGTSVDFGTKTNGFALAVLDLYRKMLPDPVNGPGPPCQSEATSLEGQVDFALNSAELPSDLTALRSVAACLRQHPTSVLIEGHADGVGTSAYNLNLSRKRANAVKKFLVDEGVPSSLLHTYGYGQGYFWRPYSPADPSNRRVRIVECAIEGLGDRCTIS